MTTKNNNTRNKKIDFSKLGQKKTMSNSSCHKCKTMIPVNEENVCRARPDAKKRPEPCVLRFCSECLEKHYRESWLQRKKSNLYIVDL